MKVTSLGEGIKRMPQYLYDSLIEQYDRNIVDTIIRGYMADRYTTFRVNTLKIDTLYCLNSLKDENLKCERVSFLDEALILKNGEEKDLEKTLMYQGGQIYLQSLSSMLPVVCLNPKKNTEILDMAAAPGGKTTQIATHINNEGKILACELDKIRCERLKFNVAKQSATSVECINIDSRKLEDDLKFDQILLDAPCSGSGTINLNNKQTYISFSEKLVIKSCSMQYNMLKKAINLLKNGKTMIYSTCSILKMENEEVVKKILDEFPNVEVVPLYFKGIETLPKLPCSIKGALLVCPSDMYEGFFVCKLRKK